jgi:hypothetical protein
MKNQLLLLLFFPIIYCNANDTLYEQRRADYISTSLANFNDDALVLQAYQNVPLNLTQLNINLGLIKTRSTSDFELVKLVRIMFLSAGQYDSLIFDAIDPIPFWLTKSDTLRGYWSENHMIMWMSSDWLLNQKYGKPIDPDLENRLRHYLRLKNKYGFYEFFSSTYLPYTLSGLLNLADFATDVEIKHLATQAAKRLLIEMLMVTNDKGVYFPAAGRNFNGKYSSAYNQNHNNLIYMLTGLGVAPTQASHSGVFLATSNLQVDTITQSRVDILNKTLRLGHPFDSTDAIHTAQSTLDKTIFKWSFGGYFHPNFVIETTNLLADSNLWKHVDFRPFYQLRSLPPSTFYDVSVALSVASKSTVLTDHDYVIFKNKSVTLTSVQDFWKGKLGYQQIPCVANVNSVPVYLASGKVDSTWSVGSSNANEHLPYVKQNKNVALLMYRPETKASILPYYNNEVALRWRDNNFDESSTNGNWLLGRKESSYVGVRRYCLDTVMNFYGCYDITDGQSWVIVVGDSSMYGSYQNFKNLVQQSTFSESRSIDSANNQSIYSAQITFDTITIGHDWKKDTLLSTGLFDFASSVNSLYPNPSYDNVYLEMNNKDIAATSFELINILGQNFTSHINIKEYEKGFLFDVRQLPSGVYHISYRSNDRNYTYRFIKAG